MAGITVTPVETQTELEEFITFPWKVYARDPYWVPPLISERKQFLNPELNPFFKHASARFFLARRNGQTLGTVGAISNRLYNEFQGGNVGFFGFFEVLDDQEAATQLLRAAESWVRDAGHERIIGPAQYSTNDEVGLLVDGFEDAPRVLMTYNPRRYQSFIESSGYAKAMDMFAYRSSVGDLAENVPPKILRVTEKIRKRWNLNVRKLDMKHFPQELGRFKQIYNASWERNWGFVPFTDEEIDHTAAQLKQFLDPDLVLFIEREGQPIAVAFALPDMNQPLRMAYPRPGSPEILTLLKLLWHWKVRKRLDWLRVIALGVIPEYRGQGVDALMYLELIRAAARKGFTWGESSWILESNDMMNRSLQLLGAQVYKTYRMYQREL